MKPVVHYINDAVFGFEGGYEVAEVFALDHPKLGCQRVYTSVVIKKEEDGTFETLNTSYKPVKQEGN